MVAPAAAPSAIVNVSSTAGRVTRGGTGAYSASKFALAGWSDALYAEERRHGVHVGLVLPGSAAARSATCRATTPSRRSHGIVKGSDPSTIGVSRPTMLNARVETTAAADGTPIVQAVFDLSEVEVAAVARAVDVSRTEQFRHEELSADDVVAMRELTALADELTALAGYGSAVTLMLRPARLVALRDTLDAFVAHRDEAGFTRDEDRDAYAVSLALAAPLADLSADALRAALDAAAH